jgi:hypothetical protein
MAARHIDLRAGSLPCADPRRIKTLEWNKRTNQNCEAENEEPNDDEKQCISSGGVVGKFVWSRTGVAA